MMEREVGNRSFPIWLLGDSNPEQWQTSLLTPLDPRHPVRHNIWTPLLDTIQDTVFRANKSRVETKSLYIRNAVGNPRLKPNVATVEWSRALELEVSTFREMIRAYSPKLLLCFGAFAFEFARRALGQEPKRKYGYWGARRLGEEFRQRIGQFDPNVVNVLPLLHRSISGGKFIQSHNYFCDDEGANYFEVVGNSIADKLLQHRAALLIWVE
jgi:hypothetical protein